MKTCKTCVHWSDGSCDSPKWVYFRDSSLPPDGVMYSDADWYHADFVTGPDFGCIHHEALATETEEE